MRRPYLLTGALLVVFGIAGFFQDPLLGLFEVNPVHNLVHLVSGLFVLAAASYGIGTMRTCGKMLGLLYLALAIAGFALPAGDIFRVMHLNQPDNMLHLYLAGFFMYYGLLAPPRL